MKIGNFLYAALVYIFLSNQKIYALNILFFDSKFPALTQTFILNQVTSMIDKGHDVTVLSLTRKDKMHSNVASKPGRLALHPDVEKYELLKKTYYGYLPPHKRDYDVILCEFGHLGKMFMHISKRLNITGKFITFFRGRDLSALPGKNKSFYTELFKKGDYFLTVSHYFRLKLIRLGCDSDKVGVLHSTIDCVKFPFKERNFTKDGTIRIVTTNRLVEKKGTKYAIKAVAQVAKKYPNIEFNIIGGGVLYKELDRLIKQLGMEDNIHLLGWRSHEEVIKILDRAHIFMLPSVTGHDGDREGIPNAIMEAMAMGLPIISTYHSGIPELVKNRVTGYLVPERNVDALANRLEILIAHPDIGKKMGLLGRRYVENYFNKPIVNDQLHNLCLYLAQKK